MKNLKAVVLIILGAFFLATVFAFGAEGTAYRQLRGDAFGTGRSAAGPTLTVSSAREYKAEAAADSPKPGFKEKAAAVMGHIRRPLTGAMVGAFIGFLIVGTIAGALTGGVVGLILTGMAM